MLPGTEIIPQVNIAGVVKQYDLAMQLIDEGFQKLAEADKILEVTFDHHTHASLQYGDYSKERVKENILASAWRHVMKWINIESIMSAEDIKKMEERFSPRYYTNNKDIPPFTLEEIQTIIFASVQNSDVIFRKSLTELWNFLTPGKYNCYQKLVTDRKNADEIQPYVILHSCMEARYRTWSLNSYRDKDIRQMDKVFHTLDGKKYDPSGPNLYNAITSSTLDVKSVESEYFQVKMYQNGNLHVRFKRLDLLKKVNEAIGISDKLKGQR